MRAGARARYTPILADVQPAGRTGTRFVTDRNRPYDPGRKTNEIEQEGGRESVGKKMNKNRELIMAERAAGGRAAGWRDETVLMEEKRGRHRIFARHGGRPDGENRWTGARERAMAGPDAKTFGGKTIGRPKKNKNKNRTRNDNTPYGEASCRPTGYYRHDDVGTCKTCTIFT